MTRVLVTGAAGFIGSHLSERLIADGHEVVGVDNFDPFYPRAIKEANLEQLRGQRRFQFTEADVVTDPLPVDGVSAIVHLAAKAGVRPSWEDAVGYAIANVVATVRIVEAARRGGIARVVFGSSSSVYGDTTPAPFEEGAAAVAPISPYAATKRAAELVTHPFALTYGLKVACLRFFTVYGPRQRPDLAIHSFARLIRAGAPVPVFGDGSTRRDYTYIDDAVQGCVAALGWTASAPAGSWAVYNIGGGEPVRLDRLIAILAAAMRRPVRTETRPAQPGDVPMTAADLTRAERDLGYRPQVSIEEGVRRFVCWYEETHGREP